MTQFATIPRVENGISTGFKFSALVVNGDAAIDAVGCSLLGIVSSIYRTMIHLRKNCRIP